MELKINNKKNTKSAYMPDVFCIPKKRQEELIKLCRPIAQKCYDRDILQCTAIYEMGKHCNTPEELAMVVYSLASKLAER